MDWPSWIQAGGSVASLGVAGAALYMAHRSGKMVERLQAAAGWVQQAALLETQRSQAIEAHNAAVAFREETRRAAEALLKHNPQAAAQIANGDTGEGAMIGAVAALERVNRQWDFVVTRAYILLDAADVQPHRRCEAACCRHRREARVPAPEAPVGSPSSA